MKRRLLISLAALAGVVVTTERAQARLTAVGMGKERPLVPNDTDANRALNRRVEFHIENQSTTVKEMVKTPEGGTVVAPPRSPVQPKKPATNP